MSAETRGHAIKKRMEDLGLGPVRLAAEAGVNRKTVARALEGHASERMLDDIEHALERLERRVGPAEPMPLSPQPNGGNGEDKIVFRLTGLARAEEVIIEGTGATGIAEAKAAMERLMSGLDQEDGQAT